MVLLEPATINLLTSIAKNVAMLVKIIQSLLPHFQNFLEKLHDLRSVSFSINLSSE